MNVVAVILGSCAGLVLHAHLPKRIMDTAFFGVGLFTIVLGVSMALRTSNFLIMILSVVVGSIVGELIDIDKGIMRFGEWLKKRFSARNERFSEGFITAFLLYCMGSMTILGAFEEGIEGTATLLVAKSLLDGFSSIVLAATMGIGVLFSFLPLLVYQGGLTVGASVLEPVLSEGMIAELSAVGGILLLGLGVTMLDIKKIRVVNMLPSLFIAVVLSYFFV